MATRRIMIVDDDTDLLEELAEVLSCVGYEPVKIADSGDVARLARENPPDVVLLDLQMPAKDGFSVALELARMPETSGIPIIGMTGVYNGSLWANLMLLCGFDACLIKPIDPEKLFEQIEMALGERIDESGRAHPVCSPRDNARRTDEA